MHRASFHCFQQSTGILRSSQPEPQVREDRGIVSWPPQTKIITQKRKVLLCENANSEKQMNFVF